DLADGIEIETGRNALLDHGNKGGSDLVRLFTPDKIEIGIDVFFLQLGHLAFVDPVGAGDDAAVGGLAEYLGEADYWHDPAVDQVVQHHAWADRGQLIDIAHQQQTGISG